MLTAIQVQPPYAPFPTLHYPYSAAADVLQVYMERNPAAPKPRINPTSDPTPNPAANTPPEISHSGLPTFQDQEYIQFLPHSGLAHLSDGKGTLITRMVHKLEQFAVAAPATTAAPRLVQIYHAVVWEDRHQCRIYGEIMLIALPPQT